MMTRKDFQETARILRESIGRNPDAVRLRLVRSITLEFADYYESVNPRFNRELFLESSGFNRPEPDFF